MRARASHLLLAAILAATLGVSGCDVGEQSTAVEGTTPLVPNRCEDEPEGVAADGVNDEQGGSTPGIDPCDSPGN